MQVSYDKLWKVLIDRRMNRSALKDSAGISFNVLAKMGRNEFVSMESLYKICESLQCNVGDIIEFKFKSSLEENDERKSTSYCTISGL